MKILLTLCCIAALLLQCGVAFAYSETIRLQAGESVVRTLMLNEGEAVSGRLTLVGDSINFSVTDPGEAIVISHSNVALADFEFTASTTGQFSFHFENLFSEQEKFVTLNYDVRRLIFGFPQEFIVLFFIVGLALVGVVVFVAMSPKP